MEDPRELEKIRDRESDITKERIQKACTYLAPSITRSRHGLQARHAVHAARNNTCKWLRLPNPLTVVGLVMNAGKITLQRSQKCHPDCCCMQMLDAGANVILTTKGIDDMSLKYFVEAGAIACRRVPKEDLRCAVVPFFSALTWQYPASLSVRPQCGCMHSQMCIVPSLRRLIHIVTSMERGHLWIQLGGFTKYSLCP